MGCSLIDRFVAERKMRLKNTNHCLSFVTTLWKGEVIMCTLNNLDRRIINVFCIQTIEEDDFDCLESLVNKFIFGSVVK